MCYFLVKRRGVFLTSVVMSQYTRVTYRRTDDRQTTDRRHKIMKIAELFAMPLRHSAKKKFTVSNKTVLDSYQMYAAIQSFFCVQL